MPRAGKDDLADIVPSCAGPVERAAIPWVVLVIDGKDGCRGGSVHPGEPTLGVSTLPPGNNVAVKLASTPPGSGDATLVMAHEKKVSLVNPCECAQLFQSILDFLQPHLVHLRGPPGSLGRRIAIRWPVLTCEARGHHDRITRSRQGLRPVAVVPGDEPSTAGKIQHSGQRMILGWHFRGLQREKVGVRTTRRGDTGRQEDTSLLPRSGHLYRVIYPDRWPSRGHENEAEQGQDSTFKHFPLPLQPVEAVRQGVHGRRVHRIVLMIATAAQHFLLEP